MRTAGLVIVILLLVAFGSVIAERFAHDRSEMDETLGHQVDCKKFTEFECIAKSGCSPVYAENSPRKIIKGLPTREQGRGLNDVNIGGVFITCVADTLSGGTTTGKISGLIEE